MIWDFKLMALRLHIVQTKSIGFLKKDARRWSIHFSLEEILQTIMLFSHVYMHLLLSICLHVLLLRFQQFELAPQTQSQALNFRFLSLLQPHQYFCFAGKCEGSFLLGNVKGVFCWLRLRNWRNLGLEDLQLMQAH